MPGVNRFLILVLLTVLLSISATTAVYASSPLARAEDSASGLDLQAKAALLMETSSGRVLFQKNGQERLPPASVTKIMTALLVVETKDLDRSVIISEHAALTPECTVYLQEGENLMRHNLLYACMLNSANDAATALAESVAGSEAVFVRLMNQRAGEIGMLDTHFCNPHGLHDARHYTTAYDLALLTRQALSYPEFCELVSTKTKVIDWAHHQDRQLFNQNRLLSRYAGAIGVKTGYTRQAGNCVVGAATRGGMTLIAVALNSSTVYGDLAQMLDYGFNNYQMKQVDMANLSHSLPVADGMGTTVTAVPAEPMQLALTAAEAPYLQVDVAPGAGLKAPIEAGDIIGSVKLRLYDDVVAQSDLIALDSVAACVARPQSLQVFWQQVVLVMSRWHLYNLLVLLALGYYSYHRKGWRPTAKESRRLF